MIEDQRVNGCLLNELSLALKQKSQAGFEAGEQGCCSSPMQCHLLVLHAYTSGVNCKTYTVPDFAFCTQPV